MRRGGPGTEEGPDMELREEAWSPGPLDSEDQQMASHENPVDILIMDDDDVPSWPPTKLSPPTVFPNSLLVPVLTEAGPVPLGGSNKEVGVHGSAAGGPSSLNSCAQRRGTLSSIL